MGYAGRAEERFKALVRTPLFKSLGWKHVERLHLQVSRHHPITRGIKYHVSNIKYISKFSGWWNPYEYKFGLTMQRAWKQVRQELVAVLSQPNSEALWELPQVDNQ